MFRRCPQLGLMYLIPVLLFTLISACDLLVDLLAGGTHEVKQLDEYVDYLGGRDLYLEKGVGALRFACDDLRDQLVYNLHRNLLDRTPFSRIPRRELDRLGMVGAKREGKVLHLMNRASVSGIPLARWGEEMRDVLSSDLKTGSSGWIFTAAVRRLFDSVVLHASGNRTVEITIQSRFKCSG